MCAQKEAATRNLDLKSDLLPADFTLVIVEWIFTAHDKSCWQPTQGKWLGLVRQTQTANCGAGLQSPTGPVVLRFWYPFNGFLNQAAEWYQEQGCLFINFFSSSVRD